MDTTIEIPEKKKSMSKLVPRTNTSDVNSTYGSFQFDDTLKSKDVSLVSKLRDLVERMDFMEKSVMVRLDRIEKRLTRLEEEKDNGEKEVVVVQQKEDAVVQPPKVKSVVKQKLRKVIKKKKISKAKEKEEGFG